MGVNDVLSAKLEDKEAYEGILHQNFEDPSSNN